MFYNINVVNKEASVHYGVIIQVPEDEIWSLIELKMNINYWGKMRVLTASFSENLPRLRSLVFGNSE